MSSKLNQLHLLGISYRKTDFRIREKFAVDQKHYAHILHATEMLHIEELFILSTCNRTEYYLIHPHIEDLVQHLSRYLDLDFKDIEEQTYRLKGIEALRHFFNVASGLDSQIIGDQEIVAQIKEAVQLPKHYGKIGNFMERMINTGLNASRLVKRNTSISNGSTSVAHAAVNWIRKYDEQVQSDALLIGAGQIGRAVAYNFAAVLPEKKLFITNRTAEKASLLAHKLANLEHLSWNDWEGRLKDFSHLIVCTAAGGKSLLHREHFESISRKQTLLDLTLPSDVNPNVRQAENLTYLNVDQVSSVMRETMEERKRDLPKAQEILERSVADFVSWDTMRKYAPIIQMTKKQLATVHEYPEVDAQISPGGISYVHSDKIDQLVKNMAKEAKVANIHACSYMKAFQNFVENHNGDKKMFKIGTRDSELAMYQAHQVEQALLNSGLNCIIESVKSEGDLNLEQPIYEMGVQGVFTRTLDSALLAKRIDFAVHSLKDVPTKIAEGLQVAGVLPRADHRDVAILKKGLTLEDLKRRTALIATSSIRRKAMWLHRFPHHQFQNIRGNIQTRLKKFYEGEYDVLIMAKAAIDRMETELHNTEILDFLPAPAQGAIACLCRSGDKNLLSYAEQFNNQETFLTVGMERQFLRLLEGGCSSPIGALARVEQGQLYFKGEILSLDGSKHVAIEKSLAAGAYSEGLMMSWVEEIKAQGGEEILLELKGDAGRAS